MHELFTIIFYQPLFNLLIAIYNFIPGHDLGVSIIVLTVVVKVVLFPLSWMQIRSQQIMQDVQPKLDAIKAQYKDDKQAQTTAQMALFKEHKINPLASCLPLLVQFPFLIALFYVFVSGVNSQSLNLLYPFVYNPGQLNETFLGLFSLTKPNIYLAVLAGLGQFWQTKMLMTKRPPKVDGSKDEDMAAMMSKQMMFIMPVVTIVLGVQFASGLVLYWLAQTLVSVVQQYIFLRHHKNRKSV